METDREIISGFFGKITNSYFLDKPGYITIFNELLRDWEFNKSTIPAFIKLVDDASSGKEIKKTVQEYGAEKVILPDCKIMPSDLLLPAGIPTKEYRPGGSLKELTLLTILKQIELCKDEKNNYDIVKLQEIFGTSPRGLLEIMFEYPDFPASLKKPILEAAFQCAQKQKLKKNIKSPIKEDSQNISLHKEDYKTESYNLLKELKNRVVNNELREKINMHIFMQDLPYDKKEIGEILDAIVALPKIDDNSKKNIFSHVIKIRFDGKFQPLELLKEAVRYLSGGDYYGILWKECAFKQYPQLYTWVVNCTFQQYPFYTAKKLIHLAKTASNLEEKKTALALVGVHKLLQKVIDSDPTIMQKAMKDKKFCELLLFNGVKFPQEVIHDAIKTNDNKLLMLLKEYAIDFSDPAFIKIALGTNRSFKALSFLVDQQKSISQKNGDRIFKLVCERFNTEDEQNIHKAYWYTKLNGNALPFEMLLLDKKRLERDIEKKQKIITDIKELCRKITWNVNKLEDMDEIVAELSSITLLKDQNFLNSILKEVEFRTNDISQNLDYYMQHRIENLNEKKSWLNVGMRISACGLGMALCEFSLLNICLGLAALGSSRWVFNNYQGYIDKHNEAKKRIYLYERLNYLKGYICGLLGLRDTSSKIIRPQEKIRILDNEISGKGMVKLLYPFLSALLAMKNIDNTQYSFTFSDAISCSVLLTNIFFVWGHLCNIIFYEKFVYPKAKELLQNSFNRSKADGFLDGLLYAKNCQNELPCNSDFYEGDNVFPQFLVENWKKNSQQSQEFEKLAQSCKQKVKSGFFEKCMNSIIACFYNKDLANKFERDTYKYSNQHLKNKIEKERKFTYATLTHNKLLYQPEL